jgi:hypothetical protein
MIKGLSRSPVQLTNDPVRAGVSSLGTEALRLDTRAILADRGAGKVAGALAGDPSQPGLYGHAERQRQPDREGVCAGRREARG